MEWPVGQHQRLHDWPDPRYCVIASTFVLLQLFICDNDRCKQCLYLSTDPLQLGRHITCNWHKDWLVLYSSFFFDIIILFGFQRPMADRCGRSLPFPHQSMSLPTPRTRGLSTFLRATITGVKCWLVAVTLAANLPSTPALSIASTSARICLPSSILVRLLEHLRLFSCV